jgi:L-fuconolactonase
MTRRELLLSALAARPYSGPIVDTHVHFYDPTRPQGVPWPSPKETGLYRRTLPEDFRSAAAGLGITGVVVVEASSWLEDNQWVLDLAERDRLVLAVVGHLDPGKAEFRGHLKRFAKNSRFRGIRLNGNAIRAGMDAPEWIDDMRRLSDAGLQLDAIGGEPMFGDLARLSDRLPNLRVVIDHLPFYSSGPTLLGELKSRSEVYAKVSGVINKPEGHRAALDELWDVFGAKRLIYASNWPVSNKFGSYSQVFAVVKEYFTAKGSQVAEGFFWKNARSAYRW